MYKRFLVILRRIYRTPSPMLWRYLLKLGVRVFIVAFVFGIYLYNRDFVYMFATTPIVKGINCLHIIWAILMVMMIRHIWSPKILTMAHRKSIDSEYEEVEGYSRLKLLEFVHESNIRAWKVMLIWLLFNSVWGILYVFHIFNEADLIAITMFYFLCDYICILFFCPFQKLVLNCQCCVNCRIYDWGHFMMFTPMLLIKNFFSWSLFITATVVLIHWELIYAKHPERFWRGSNKRIQCVNCKDKTCTIKKGLAKGLANLQIQK